MNFLAFLHLWLMSLFGIQAPEELNTGLTDNSHQYTADSSTDTVQKKKKKKSPNTPQFNRNGHIYNGF